MSKSVYWESYPVVFFRLAQYPSRLLETLQWSSAICGKFEDLFVFHVKENMLVQQVHSHQHLIDAKAWTDLSRWLEHAHLRKEAQAPRILRKDETLNDAIHQLIHTRRHLQTLQNELLTSLKHYFLNMWAV